MKRYNEFIDRDEDYEYFPIMIEEVDGMYVLYEDVKITAIMNFNLLEMVRERDEKISNLQRFLDKESALHIRNEGELYERIEIYDRQSALHLLNIEALEKEVRELEQKDRRRDKLIKDMEETLDDINPYKEYK